MDLYRKYQACLENFERQQALPKHGKCVSEVPNETAFLRGKLRESPCSSGSPVSLSSSNVLEAETCHNAPALALSKIVSLRWEVLSTGVPLYDRKNFPPKDLTHRAMHAFIRGTRWLLFMWKYSQADKILDRLYDPEIEPDSVTIAERFIVLLWVLTTTLTVSRI